MPFQIHPLREFLVRPALPPAIERLSELAYNLLWSWDPAIREVFRRLDHSMWNVCEHNPVLMLGRVPQSALERAAGEPRFLALYRRACERFDDYMSGDGGQEKGGLVAYFSMEYGLVDCMGIYSGGLGVLSGDHLKASSDAGIPLVGVGLLYQKGYHQQFLSPDGWQQERYPVNDFYTLPVRPVEAPGGGELRITVKLPSGPTHAKVWRMDIGRVKLYLLDTNIPDNERADIREITALLYGGDSHMRIRQEFLLGIGGLRALRVLGLEPAVYHMNEGHSAFLAIERIRVLMADHGLNFDEALDASRENNVFTTHTSVPAGIDLFDPGLMYEYFQEYCREAGIPFDQLVSLGRRNPQDLHERFSMAIAAIKTSAHRNGVSRLHQSVSQEMWQDLWPGLPVWEVPVAAITNGVHLPSILNGDLAVIYDRYLQPDWRERYQEPQTWDLVREIPDQELWEAHRRRKRGLIAFVRDRLKRSARGVSTAELKRLDDVLDPDALTIGIARRFATYKRATLIFHDFKRLKKILTDPARPVQLIFAGKAHPRDQEGKKLIQKIVQLSRDPEIGKHLVFLEDYSLMIARELVQAVDVWLNNPRRGEEACGTSGMKAGLNGVLNLSILDGWFDEAYIDSGGWAIGDPVGYSPDQDEIHANGIYSLLENEIVPMYYADREKGAPFEWMRRVKQSLMRLSPRFNSQRMLAEYATEFYKPAQVAYESVARNGFEVARARVRWNARVAAVWDKVSIVEVGSGPDGSLLSGKTIPLRVTVDLAGLAAEDVRVEAVIGRVGVNGYLAETEVISLTPIESHGTCGVFFKEFVPTQTGRLGYSLRISPDHCQDPLTRPCNALLKWG